jgi:hypothetical protein
VLRLLAWGECLGRGWRWGELEEANKPLNHPKCKKGTKNRWFPKLIDLIIAKKAFSYTKLLHKIYFKDVFKEMMNLKLF